MVFDNLYNLVDLVLLSDFGSVISNRDSLFSKLRLLLGRALAFLGQTRGQVICKLYQSLFAIFIPFFLVCLVKL